MVNQFLDLITSLDYSTAEASSKIDEDLVFDSILLFWAGSRKLSFIPKWSCWFDSFKVKQLDDTEFPYIPIKGKLEKKRYVKKNKAYKGH